MTQTAEEVRVGADGQIYVADVGTTLPTSVDDSLDGAFSSALGFVSEDGVTITDGKTVTDIGAWQSFYPIRELVTAREFSVAFSLRQWNRDTIALAFGGGTFTDLGTPDTQYSPPDAATLDERALVVDYQDGDVNYRLVVPRCLATETVTAQLARASAADLPITMKVLAPTAGTDPWFMLTDDPAVAS